MANCSYYQKGGEKNGQRRGPLCGNFKILHPATDTRDTIDGQRIAANRHSARNPCSAEAPETREINFEW